ncbi:MAG: RDD family protein [Parafilimonas sp.]|nr:RDD family protein [Parafilimonas sp.]
MEDLQTQDLLTETEFNVQYGKFWPRFWALLLDGLILAVLAPITFFNRYEWKNMVVLIIISAIQLSYKPFFEYRYGATPGKMALKLKVVSYEFQKATIEQVVLRNIFHILSGLIVLGLGIYAFIQPEFSFASTSSQYAQIGKIGMLTLTWEGLMFVIFLIDFIFLVSSPDSRSLHDRIGRTFVIRANV